MELKQIRGKQLDEILRTTYKNSFPFNERKSYKQIKHLNTTSFYECLGAYEDGQIKSMAFCHIHKPFVLLDFLAVIEQKNHGVGTQTINLIKQRYPNCTIIVELSDPDTYCDKTHKMHAHFYDINNFVYTGQWIMFFGEKCKILTSKPVPQKRVVKALKEIYNIMYTPEGASNHISFGDSNENV